MCCSKIQQQCAPMAVFRDRVREQELGGKLVDVTVRMPSAGCQTPMQLSKRLLKSMGALPAALPVVSAAWQHGASSASCQQRGAQPQSWTQYRHRQAQRSPPQGRPQSRRLHRGAGSAPSRPSRVRLREQWSGRSCSRAAQRHPRPRRRLATCACAWAAPVNGTPSCPWGALPVPSCLASRSWELVPSE